MKPTHNRRTQILSGMAVPPDRGPVGINDRRSTARFLPQPGWGRPTVGSCVSYTANVSAKGMAVVASLELGVGDSVPVKLAGRDTAGARIVWKRGSMVGLELAKGVSLAER